MSTIKELQALGIFVSEELLKREVELKVGKETVKTEIYVKELSSGDYENMFVVDGPGRSRTAEVIHKCIRFGKDGKEELTYAQAYKLKPDTAAAFIGAFHEVNSPKKS